ncbi:lactosylceramide 4-alpha-galactosyltransferase-like [Macadamia integrifolia]|uniref:lactosylceramide 4-alpha-galactosyltransferase-like n=1 Tax=Macadamia integrifolia TaxID=60698 RepID=UPI001C52F68B|nr:lactosylceramide 4-alpha-galactosyltransferase-like [Macadamia integrifolia]
MKFRYTPKKKPGLSPQPRKAVFNSEKERIAWFKQKLRAFDVFKSTKLPSKFAERTRKFFDNTCEIQFFMTWISPVRFFRRREILALESVFKAHPHGCLMILSGTMDSIHGNRILKPLQDLGFRVVAVKPDLSFLLKNTPAEAWFREMKKGIKDPGEIPLAQNLSNLLRLVVLYKYGGVYLDTDFIVLKKFSGLRNTIGAQSMDRVTGKWTRLNNAVLIFDKNHTLLFNFIEEFSLTFNGNRWGHNGPYMVSRVVKKVRRRPLYNFTVLPPMAFYPVDWTRIGAFFQKPVDRAMSRWVSSKLLQLSRETYGIHLWNRQSSKLRIGEGSIIGKLISDHCVLCEDMYSV